MIIFNSLSPALMDSLFLLLSLPFRFMYDAVKEVIKTTAARYGVVALGTLESPRHSKVVQWKGDVPVGAKAVAKTGAKAGDKEASIEGRKYTSTVDREIFVGTNFFCKFSMSYIFVVH